MDTLEQPSPPVKNNPRTINGWAFFDWANSAYALVITVAIFPAYFLEHDRRSKKPLITCRACGYVE
jgi:MFS-type transporter involved in bile tolerance (Atg22 family)